MGIDQDSIEDYIYYVHVNNNRLYYDKVDLFEMQLHGSQMHTTSHGFCVTGYMGESVIAKCLKEK